MTAPWVGISDGDEAVVIEFKYDCHPMTVRMLGERLHQAVTEIRVRKEADEDE